MTIWVVERTDVMILGQEYDDNIYSKEIILLTPDEMIARFCCEYHNREKYQPHHTYRSFELVTMLPPEVQDYQLIVKQQKAEQLATDIKECERQITLLQDKKDSKHRLLQDLTSSIKKHGS